MAASFPNRMVTSLVSRPVGIYTTSDSGCGSRFSSAIASGDLRRREVEQVLRTDDRARRVLARRDALFFDQRELGVRFAALEPELLLERLEHLVAAAQHARDVRAHADGLGPAGLAAEHRIERRDAVDVGVRQVERGRDEAQRVIGQLAELLLRAGATRCSTTGFFDG